MLAAVVADVSSAAVVSHPDKEVRCLHLTGSRRSDAPPDVLFVGTQQGLVLRFKLSISAAKMGASTAAGARAVMAKKHMKKLLMGANVGIKALRQASTKERAELLSSKPVFSAAKRNSNNSSLSSIKSLLDKRGKPADEASAAAATSGSTEN